MKKNDIATLVAAGLKAEAKSYRRGERQHIRAVNGQKHDRVPLRPPLPLPVPTRGQLRKAFKDQRLNWWRGLFAERVTLDQAAGMLLGFSQVMAEHAIFVADKSNLELPLSLRTRPISDVLVKAFTDMRDAIANSDINKPSVTTYAVGELIEWAKEKDFLADEVLAVWKEKAKPQTKKQERRWTPEFLKEVEAYRSTHTEAETAKQFGVSGPLVRRKLKNHKESNKPKPPSPFAGLGKR